MAPGVKPIDRFGTRQLGDAINDRGPDASADDVDELVFRDGKIVHVDTLVEA
jgi:hypothetical protein